METRGVNCNTEMSYISGMKSSERRLEFSGYPEEDSGPDMIFWMSFFSAQAVALIILALLLYWGTLSGGFAWASDANLQFNYHPLLMVLGLVLCYGDAIMIYRALYFLPKWILKTIHTCMQLSAIILSSIGLAAVFENHRRLDRADMYSLHSWFGIGTFAFFCVQFVSSFLIFVFPGAPAKIRATVMPFHRLLGVALFLLAVATSLMGTTEKLFFMPAYSAGNYTHEGAVGNSIGIFLAIFSMLVVFLTTHSLYKRRPLPEDVAPTS